MGPYSLYAVLGSMTDPLGSANLKIGVKVRLQDGTTYGVRIDVNEKGEVSVASPAFKLP